MIWPFNRRKKSAPAVIDDGWSLDEPVIWLTKDEPFTIEDACKGVQVFGMTGSGKSSGSGKFLALHYLRSQFGGLVLCAKNSEAETWIDYCRLTNREADVIRFSPSQPHRFNFLDFELNRSGEGAGLTENLLSLFQTIAEITNRSGGSGRGSEDGYWKNSLSQLMRNTIDLCVMATGKLSIPELYRIVLTAPTSEEKANDPKWHADSNCFQALKLADAKPLSGYQKHDLNLVADYFLLEFPGISEKTRSIIVSTFTTMIDVLNRGILRELFCTTTTVTPADCLDGKIIIVDLPLKEFSDIGLYAAVIWKYLFQKVVERRDVWKNRRPVFLFADESHLFTTKFDALFQSTARSSRCATVYLTQNINAYYAQYGGNGEAGQGRAHTLSLLGNLCHVIVHALGDYESAEFMSNLCGRSKKLMMSGSNDNQPYSLADDLLGYPPQRSSNGFSEQLNYNVEPSEFFQLKPGGYPACQVEALVWRGGKPFPSTRQNYLWTSFPQGDPAWIKTKPKTSKRLQ